MSDTNTTETAPAPVEAPAAEPAIDLAALRAARLRNVKAEIMAAARTGYLDRMAIAVCTAIDVLAD